MEIQKVGKPQSQEYLAPAIERVVSSEDLEREAHYAGVKAASTFAIL